MSAIAGIVNLDNRPVEPALLNAMIGRLAHRGPDSQASWVQGSVGLVHLGLWTTPQASLEAFPVELPSRWAFTGDVRLDNREDLLSSLGGNHRLSDATPDGILVTAAYEKWGEECVTHLLGDFAFAIWDHGSRKLFCARDHMGIKPFYYSFIPNRRFVFGSEIKAVLGVPGIAGTVNDERIADSYVHLINEPASTYYAHVMRLPAAHCLLLKDSLSIRRYWRLNPDKELRLSSDREYAEGFYEHFSRAIHCRMRSSHAIGSMLSGGMDSSSVACVARDWLKAHSKPELQTFSAVFDEVRECDERPYINTVIKQGHCKPNFIVLDGLSPLKNAESTLWHLDEPMQAPNLYLNSNAYRNARDLGVRVVLDGFDGDTTVSHGLGRLEELADSQRWLPLGVELFRGAGHISGDFWLSCWWSWILNRHPMGLRLKRLWSFVSRRLQPPLPKASPLDLLNPDLPVAFKFREMLRKPKPRPKSERERHFRLLERTILPTSVESMVHSAAGFRVEVRFPFMDVRLIEYCFSLPSDQKLRSGYTRFVMHEGMKGILPEKIRKRRDKSNLGPSFNKGLFKFERDNLPRIIRREADQLSAYLNLERIKECLGRFQNGVANENEILILWTTLDLALWLSNHAGSKSEMQPVKEVKQK